MEDIQHVFEEGEARYRTGDYPGALERYEELLTKGVQSGSLYYNLGNAYFKSGKIGKAILNYERALKLSPEDRELHHNLSFVRELLHDQVTSPEPPRWQKHLLKIPRLFSLDLLAFLLSFFYFSIVLTGSYAVLRVSFRKAFFRVFLIPLGALFLVLVGLATAKSLEERFSPAIVTAPQVEVHYGPSAHETKAFLLHEGTKCSIRDASGEWVLIWLPNDKGGWVHQSGIERI